MNVQQSVSVPNVPVTTGQTLEHYASFAALIETKRPTLPHYALHPQRFRTSVRRFLDSFPGITMYAIKTNPMTHVVDQIYESNIRHFDTASLAEIELIRDRYPDAHCHFIAPV